MRSVRIKRTNVPISQTSSRFIDRNRVANRSLLSSMARGKVFTTKRAHPRLIPPSIVAPALAEGVPFNHEDGKLWDSPWLLGTGVYSILPGDTTVTAVTEKLATGTEVGIDSISPWLQRRRFKLRLGVLNVERMSWPQHGQPSKPQMLQSKQRQLASPVRYKHISNEDTLPDWLISSRASL